MTGKKDPGPCLGEKGQGFWGRDPEGVGKQTAQEGAVNSWPCLEYGDSVASSPQP